MSQEQAQMQQPDEDGASQRPTPKHLIIQPPHNDNSSKISNNLPAAPPVPNLTVPQTLDVFRF